MNNCVLMAEIIQEPQLRYTADNLEIAEMLVQFSALRDGEPPATLKVVGWGNLAKEIQQNYHSGDHVIIEGRLGMNTIDRPEGFKEKRAELTVQKIHSLGLGSNNGSPAASRTSPEPVASSQKAVDRYETPPTKTPLSATSNVSMFDQDEPEHEYVPRKYEPSSQPIAPSEEPPDDIPF